MSSSWSEAADRLLWSRRNDKTAVLAADFGRSGGSIRSRLKHLNNPDHKAYQRRVLMAAEPLSSLALVSHNAAKRPAPQPLDRTESVKKRASLALSRPGITSTSTIAASTTATATTAHKVILKVNSEQQAAADKVFQGRNTFLTGAAGTGKSYLLRYIIQGFKERFTDENQIAITAPTGIAATHIDGKTIHSWAGIGLGRGSKETVVTKMLKNRAVTAGEMLECSS